MADNINKITYLDNIELMPISLGLSMRSKKEVLDRMIIDYTIASIATYAFCFQYDLIKKFLETLDKKYNITSIINGKEKELIINIFNKRIDSFHLEEITFRFESSYFCMWTLGLVDSVTYNKKCSVKLINELLLNSLSYNDILNKCNLRNVNELLNYYNGLSKIIYSDIKIEKNIENIINAQDNVIRYIILYNFNKNGLKVRYNNNNLKFEFNFPSNFKFVNGGSNALFALKGSNDMRILAQKINQSKIQDNLKNLMKNGFDVLDVKYVRSLYIEKRIIKVNLKKDNLLVTSYYVYLNKDILRLDFSTNKLKIDSEIIYSIKVFE